MMRVTEEHWSEQWERFYDLTAARADIYEALVQRAALDAFLGQANAQWKDALGEYPAWPAYESDLADAQLGYEGDQIKALQSAIIRLDDVIRKLAKPKA